MPLDTFGKRLRVLRVDRELSQIHLRDQMEAFYGVSIGETYISELERSARMPSLEVAAAMAKVLDISLDYLGLLVDAPASYVREEEGPGYVTEEAEQIVELVENMPADRRTAALNMARTLSALPDERQRRRVASKAILDSIEAEHGLKLRQEIEKIMRDKGLFIDPDA